MNRIEILKNRVGDIVTHEFYSVCDENMEKTHDRIKSWLDIESHLQNISSLEHKILLAFADDLILGF